MGAGTALAVGAVGGLAVGIGGAMLMDELLDE